MEYSHSKQTVHAISTRKIKSATMWELTSFGRYKFYWTDSDKKTGRVVLTDMSDGDMIAFRRWEVKYNES